MQLLPHWCLTNIKPGFYDAESGTAIEQTAKVYKAMNELIEEYNTFADKWNVKIAEFNSGVIENNEAFRLGLRQEFQDFIDVAELKITSLEQYAKNEVYKTIQTIYSELKESDEIVSIIDGEIKTIKENFNSFIATVEKSQQDFEKKISGDVRSTIRIPKFEEINNEQFAELFNSCADTWVKASENGELIYGSLSLDDSDLMATQINPMLYATRDNFEFTSIYRDIWGEVKSGGVKTINCISLCNLLSMGVPYEYSRLNFHENVVGVFGYGFDICKLIDATKEGDTYSYNPNKKLDITTFERVLTQESAFDFYESLGLSKNVKSSAVGSDGDIWYDQIKPGDIMYTGSHSLFCLGVKTDVNKIVIDYVEASSRATPNVTKSSFNVTTSGPEKTIIKVARPYYTYYSANDLLKTELIEYVKLKCKGIDGPFKGIPADRDLNNYTTPGEYRCASRSNVASLLNKPNGLTKPFRLTVENIGSDPSNPLTYNYVEQTINEVTGTKYFRVITCDSTFTPSSYGDWYTYTATKV